MATPMGHLPLAPITLNSQWRISIRTWTQGPTMNQEGANQRHSNKAMQSKTMREKLHSNGTTTNAHGDHPLANSRSPS